ncbi:MAG: MoxR family ATPase [bacterium]|nr:MoxR family ATPase [bacterium]
MEESIQRIRENIQKVIVGKETIIDFLLTALVAGGHVLLEDVPGTGKTVLAKSLAKSLSMQFSRIQFTPDLLPADVTGLHYYNQKQGEFVFRAGPVFANVLLADEINRATPRTQSSLLECMEEGQVTIDGETRRLEPPFFVIATQNPIETAGTYPLPEAQMDRFLMQLAMGYPTKEEELQLLDRFLTENPLTQLAAVSGREEVERLRQKSLSVYVHPALMCYLLDVVRESREEKEAVNGVSPRGSLAFLRAVRAYALVKGRNYVVPEDIKDLAVPVLAHRMVLARSLGGGKSKQQLIRQILERVPVPTEDWNV